jgi:hypothetical protein
VDLAFGGLAERHDARIQTMDQGAKAQEVQRPTVTDIQTRLHNDVFASACTEAVRFVALKKK